jgi:hypothetical protein
MALDFSSYATPAGAPDFSMYAIPAEDAPSLDASLNAGMLRNAKFLEHCARRSEHLLHEQKQASESADHLAPLFIAGNAKTLLPLLEQHGVVLAIGTEGGVKVGRTQARQARELVDAGVLVQPALIDQYARARGNYPSGEQP